jgi:molybdopterin biosynthesis enzyme
MLPGPIQAALNAFIVFGYPLIRSFLGRPFEKPPAIPAKMSDDWEATGKFKSFDQIVYVGLRSTEHGILATPGSGETEKASFLVSKDGYMLVSGGKTRLRKGDHVWVHLLPGFSGEFGS